MMAKGKTALGAEVRRLGCRTEAHEDAMRRWIVARFELNTLLAELDEHRAQWPHVRQLWLMSGSPRDLWVT